MSSLQVKSATRAIEILEFFKGAREPRAMSDIAAALGYPQSSTTVLLKTLIALGYLNFDRGDRIFSEIRGEPLEKGRRWIGTITGGSGLYARMSGEYELTWQYVIRTEDGAFQGRAADLKGRFRLGSGPP